MQEEIYDLLVQVLEELKQLNENIDIIKSKIEDQVMYN